MSGDAGIYFQGWIHKKNDNKFIGDKWNKRWFVLYEDGILAYYANQVLEDKKNSVNLRGSKLKVLPKEHVNKKRPYCFELATKDRTFLLSCLNKVDYRSWMYWLSKGHPDAPLERSGTFYNTVIEKVLQEAEDKNRRQSLTRRVSEAAQSLFQRREQVVHSADEVKTDDQPVIQIFDGKRPEHESAEKGVSSTSLPRMESVVGRVSRPWIHLETKENDATSLPPPESEFAHKLQEFVRENDQKMEEVIDQLVRNLDEIESKQIET